MTGPGTPRDSLRMADAGTSGARSRLLLLLLLLGLNLVAPGTSLNCTNTVWEKVRGMKPESIKSTRHLHTGVDSQGIVVPCFEKCNSLNCTAFIVDLERSNCYVVESIGDDLVPEPNATFYHKICLRVPPSCLSTRYWQVERNLGSVLIDSMATVLPQPITRAECYEKCIDGAKRCKAAQFRASTDLRISDSVGTCALLKIERSTKPQAYRAAWYRDEYLEYQCHNISKTDFCSYAEYRNTLMPYSDLKVVGLNPRQCEERCDESNDGFLCRAYGIEYSDKVPTCFLHSEDTIGAGVSTLVTSPNSFYKEREPCIDMKVRCGNSSITIELRTSEPFVGRLYASGFSETCGVSGRGEKVTKLILPLPNTTTAIQETVLSCGMIPAISIDRENQTRAVVWSTVIVQFNPIIQRLGDQAVRVGCALDGGNVPGPRNVTVNTGFTFVDSNAGLPPIVSTVMNTSSEQPVVTMDILDKSLERANVTHLGQELVLRIQISPKDGPFDISAGHLVASTLNGQSSLLLLDEVGCPVTDVFPGLVKDPVDNRSLTANFSAFKFPDSQHVRFNVIVKFCLGKCEPVKCKGNVTSFGRRRRSTVVPTVTEAKVTELTKVPKNKTTDELPLQTQIIVKDDRPDQDIQPNPLRSKDTPDTLLILGSDYTEGKFCMNVGLVLFLLIFFLIVQLILIGSCVLAVRTYRRQAMRAEEDRADILARHLYGLHGGNFEISRRVRWADNNSSTLS